MNKKDMCLVYIGTCSIHNKVKPINNRQCNNYLSLVSFILIYSIFLFLKKNVVYATTCAQCQGKYVGSTKRLLHIRFKEHFNSSHSSIFKHKLTCRGTFNIDILAIEKEEANLRIKEAVFIQQLQPIINSKAECDDLRDFLYL